MQLHIKKLYYVDVLAKVFNVKGSDPFQHSVISSKTQKILCVLLYYLQLSCWTQVCLNNTGNLLFLLKSLDKRE